MPDCLVTRAAAPRYIGRDLDVSEMQLYYYRYLTGRPYWMLELVDGGPPPSLINSHPAFLDAGFSAGACLPPHIMLPAHLLYTVALCDAVALAVP